MTTCNSTSNQASSNTLTGEIPDNTPQWFRTIHETLKPSQTYARDFIVKNKKCGVFLDMGGGKTLTTLAALSIIKPSGHILVIAPKNIADNTWPDEITKWNIPTPMVSLHITPPSFFKNGKPKKQRLLKPDERKSIYADIVQNTTPTIYVTTLENVEELVNHFGRSWPFHTVVLDESQSFKNHGTKRTKALRRISSQCQRLILLTGTPATESLEGLWSQMYLLDKGARLGKYMWEFHNTYFYPAKTIPGIGTVEWGLREGAQEKIFDAVSDITVHLDNTELNIPEAHHNIMRLKLPKSVHEFMDDLKKQQVAEAEVIAEEIAQQEEGDKGNPDDYMVQAIARTIGALRSKLMQCAAGSLIVDIDPSDPQYEQATQVTTQPVIDIHDKKIKTVINIVNAHRDGSYTDDDGKTHTVPQTPVLIAYRFIAEKDRLLHELTKRGINAVTFDGSPTMITAWNNREYDAMLIHPASAGHGLNLQYGGNVLVWSTLPDSAEQYLQTNARLHRPGQDKEVLIYEIIAQGTVDAATVPALRNKKNSQKALLDALTHDVYDMAKKGC